MLTSNSKAFNRLFIACTNCLVSALHFHGRISVRSFARRRFRYNSPDIWYAKLFVTDPVRSNMRSTELCKN